MRGFGGLRHQLEVCVRVDIHVVVEGDVRVQGGVNAACGQQLDGLFQRVDALHGSAVAFGQLHVSGSQTVGGGLALQILKAVDVLVILAHSQCGVDVAVGSGESVGLGAFLGHLHAVAHHIVAACVQTGKQAVPVALHVFRLHAQLLGNGAGDLYVVAHQRVGGIVVAPRLPCALQRHHQLAALLDAVQLVQRCGAGGAGCSVLGRAAGQTEHPGGGHNTHQRNKGSAFHK